MNAVYVMYVMFSSVDQEVPVTRAQSLHDKTIDVLRIHVH